VATAKPLLPAQIATPGISTTKAIVVTAGVAR
jgi:hypothetical protein